jgi:hypothetical protein
MSLQQTIIHSHQKTWKKLTFWIKTQHEKNLRGYSGRIFGGNNKDQDPQQGPCSSCPVYAPHVPWCPKARNSCYPGLISCWSHSTEQCTLSETLLPWTARYLADVGIHFAEPAAIKTFTVTCTYVLTWTYIELDPGSMPIGVITRQILSTFSK